jgi:hypothetical protein
LFLFRSSPLIAGAAAAGPCANCCCRLIRKWTHTYAPRVYMCSRIFYLEI